MSQSEGKANFFAVVLEGSPVGDDGADVLSGGRGVDAAYFELGGGLIIVVVSEVLVVENKVRVLSVDRLME